MMPATAKTSWLLKTVNDEPVCLYDVTDDADSTITRPMTSSSRVAPSRA